MGNGFLIDITNSTSITKEVKLFNGPLPEDVSVNTMDKVYDFDALQKMAQNIEFIGNSITTGLDESIKIEIVNKNQIEKVILNGRYERSEIRINGKDEFISIMCPPNSNLYIRLNTLPSEII
jgi:hypothetical protein